MSDVDFGGPFYGCTVGGCSEEVCYPADMLRIHNGGAFCQGCWEDNPVMLGEDEYLEWHDLLAFIPPDTARIAELEAAVPGPEDIIVPLTAEGIKGIDAKIEAQLAAVPEPEPEAMKIHALAFYCWWHNQPGQNIEQGYHAWMQEARDE